MQIVTLQNPTFNLSAWTIGAVILLVIIGMGPQDDVYGSILVALFWPIFLAVLIMMGMITLPVWIGNKLREHLMVK